ncbi:hypothetical protein AB188_00340 (plasmid) [Serratia marcescens]|nr:hypothetical protein AB188_00340 [Serratia marcescens]KLP56057.1 hypothetical protein ABR40_01915 [Enterobacter kobei]
MLSPLIGGKIIILRPKKKLQSVRLPAVIVITVEMLKMDCLDISNYMQSNLHLKMHLKMFLRIKSNGSLYGYI